MMHLNGLFGNLSTWLMLIGAWVAIGTLTALALGVIARVGRGRGEER